jgi:hypothetical protein
MPVRTVIKSRETLYICDTYGEAVAYQEAALSHRHWDHADNRKVTDIFRRCKKDFRFIVKDKPTHTGAEAPQEV